MWLRDWRFRFVVCWLHVPEVECGLFIYFSQVIKILNEQPTKIQFNIVELKALFLNLTNSFSLLHRLPFSIPIQSFLSVSIVANGIYRESIVLYKPKVVFCKLKFRVCHSIIQMVSQKGVNVTNLIVQNSVSIRIYFIKMNVYLEHVVEIALNNRSMVNFSQHTFTHLHTNKQQEEKFPHLQMWWLHKVLQTSYTTLKALQLHYSFKWAKVFGCVLHISGDAILWMPSNWVKKNIRFKFTSKLHQKFSFIRIREYHRFAYIASLIQLLILCSDVLSAGVCDHHTVAMHWCVVYSIVCIGVHM